MNPFDEVLELIPNPMRHPAPPPPTNGGHVALNLSLPTPPDKTARKSPSQSSQSILKSNINENSSPLLRAYLANNKNRIFKPILGGQTVVEEGVSVLPLELVESSVTLSPCTTTSSPVSSLSPLLAAPSPGGGPPQPPAPPQAILAGPC